MNNSGHPFFKPEGFLKSYSPFVVIQFARVLVKPTLDQGVYFMQLATAFAIEDFGCGV